MEPPTADAKLLDEITCGICIDLYKDPLLLQWCSLKCGIFLADASTL